MGPRRTEEIPAKRVAALGCRLPTELPAGEILTDVTQNKWKLGSTLGCGGFGDIYLASNDIYSPVGEDAKYIIKIEPHNNGPLFVERNFYIRAAKTEMIERWCQSQNKKRIGVPTYEGSGSHIYQGERCRFLVIPRYGIDVGKLFLSHGRKLTTKLVNNLAVQMLDALEYIHSQGYAHADVKGSNILLALNEGVRRHKAEAYLVDYGLAYRFQTRAGKHKPFLHDERRAHEGTLEFTSRDAHHGTHSRRGDLETLGYNLIQWMCGRLPWEKEDGGMSLSVNPEDVHAEKESLLSNLPLFMHKCFPHKKNPPTAIMEYMKYIAELGFETKPNYSYLRSLFQCRVNQESNVPTCLFGIRESNENISYHIPLKGPYLRERKPCRPVNGEIRITRNMLPKQPIERKEFCWEAVLALHPDKLAKISVQSPPTPLTPPPSPPPPSLPTYAMLHVLQRMKQRQSGTYRHKILTKSFDNDSKTKWMTPAMEEIALKIQLAQTDASSNNSSTGTTRLTRSRVAHLKRLQHKSFKNNKTLQRKGKDRPIK